MKLAIIGAGPAGLEMLRYALKEKFECTVYEQTGLIGGTWNYTDRTDFDENDEQPVHSSMYQGLKTNLPKEVMAYEDFPYEQPANSFITQEEVLDYIHKFANYFKLVPHVKFYTKVIQVDPVENEKWIVKTKNLKNGNITQTTFDAIAVCNGHFFEPFYPSIPSMEKWKDRSIHSRSFRKAGVFKDKRVLVVGAGPSGVDISRILIGTARKVFLSYSAVTFGEVNKLVTSKPRIKYFTDSQAVFEDGSFEDIDFIIYCTGYNTTFPFLTPKCGITVDQGWVKPLYKHYINIEHPTMAVIGILHLVSPFPLFGIQARFFLALLKGNFTKTKQEMSDDLTRDRKARTEKGESKRDAHRLDKEFGNYMDDLAKIASIKRVPPVINKIFTYYEDSGFKKVNFRIISDEEFIIL